MIAKRSRVAFALDAHLGVAMVRGAKGDRAGDNGTWIYLFLGPEHPNPSVSNLRAESLAGFDQRVSKRTRVLGMAKEIQRTL